MSCAALLAEVDSSVVVRGRLLERIRRRVPLADRRRVRTKPERGGPIERLQEVSDILATASSSSPTRVRAALKEFADLRIDLKVLAAQVLLQRVESSYLRPELWAGLWACGPTTSLETPGIAGVTKVKAVFG